jgi:hypothetical protein
VEKQLTAKRPLLSSSTQIAFRAQRAAKSRRFVVKEQQNQEDSWHPQGIVSNICDIFYNSINT